MPSTGMIKVPPSALQFAMRTQSTNRCASRLTRVPLPVRAPQAEIAAEVARAGLSVGLAVVDVAEAAVAPAVRSTRSYSVQLGQVGLSALSRSWPRPSEDARLVALTLLEHRVYFPEAVLLFDALANRAGGVTGCGDDQLAVRSSVILVTQSHRWKFVIRGQTKDHSIDPLLHMLRLMWPNPDGHRSPTPEPPATLEEAQAVVQLAVTIVQWGRPTSQIVRK
jgi:hypothetical protein